MALPNIFTSEVGDQLISRIENLNNSTTPNWGKMNIGQMLAHCNVTYEMAMENRHPKAKGLKKWMLTKFVKQIVVNEKPYKKNSRTAPEFLMTTEKEFETEKNRLTNYINKTIELGEEHFEGKESNSFGALKSSEWNNMFYKHLDHHLTQFGV